MGRIDRLKLFLDSTGGGAWPFLVGGLICLVDSDNERDLRLLNGGIFCGLYYFLAGLCASQHNEAKAITGL